MRSSLYWKYPAESVLLAGHYVRERVRQRIRNIVSPPQPTLIPVRTDRKRPAAPPPPVVIPEAVDRRRLPIVSM
jgi:hypothetical protein